MNLLKKILKFFKWFFSPDGLVIAILLLLTSALVAYYVQETFQRQRYLELLELELRSNLLEANQVMTTFNRDGILLNYTPFSSKVYEAGLQSGYILTLDPQALGQVSTFYDTYLPKINDMNGKYWQLMQESESGWLKCIIKVVSSNTKDRNACKEEENIKTTTYKTYSQFMAQTAGDLGKNILKIQFNPTQERLHNPLLKFLMGDKRLKVQE